MRPPPRATLPLPLPLPLPLLVLVLVLLLVLLFTWACGGDHLDAARFQLSLGNLERAEALLSEVGGEAAVALRAELAAARAHREALAGELERFRAARGDRLGRELRAELEALLAGERDVAVRGWIERELSATADWVAERDAGRPTRRVWLPRLGIAPERTDEVTTAEVRRPTDPLLESLLDDVRVARTQHSWREALALCDMLVADVPDAADALRQVVELRAKVEKGAALEAREVLRKTLSHERVGGVDQALRYLSGELWRFPDAGEPEALHRAALELRERWEAEARRVAREEAREEARERAREEQAREQAGEQTGEQTGEEPPAEPGPVARTDPPPVEPGPAVTPRPASAPARGLEPEGLGAEVDRLLARLGREEGPVREATTRRLEDLAQDSPVAAEGLAAALGQRWADAVRTIGWGSTLRRLEPIAQLRLQLDTRRELALGLIFDSQTYFYPYDPPAVAGKTVTHYWEAQRAVEERVAAVRETWGSEVQVELPEAFRRALADLAWVRGHRDRVGEGLAVPDGWPDWVAGIDPRLDRVAVGTFAWTAREAAELATDRAVRTYNEARWSAEPAPDTTAPLPAEREQVRLTNDYRQMMGRRVLAWNARIQEAARMHSEYMSRTGHFGHFEPDDPDRRTPHDRMVRAGYRRAASENCHHGRLAPRAAHEAWRQSSAHHRNLLQAAHREMACALVAEYWTQDFGRGTDFESELDPWRD